MNLRKRIGQELAHQYYKTIEREHPLRQLFWECTLRCNVHCRHCGSDCKRVAGVPDMPGQDFLRVLDSVERRCNPHKVFVIITGGEPLVRDDLEEICSEIYRRGFPWGLVTNGLYFTPERFESLRKAGMRSVALSLDGLEANHNWLRGHKDSFRMTSQAIDLLAKSDILFDCVTCVNYSDLPAIRDFLIAKGVKYWRIYTIFPMGRAKDDPDMRLSDQEFRGVFEFIWQTRREGHIHANYGCEGFLGPYEGEVRDYYFHCRAGVNVASVLVDGSISGCTSIRSNFHQGNIYKDNLWDVWQNRFEKYRDRGWAKKGQCADCDLWKYCEGSGMHLYDDNEQLLFCHYHRLMD